MKPINYHGNYMVLELTNKCNCNCVHCIRDKGVPYLSIPHHTGRAAKYRDFDLPFHNPERETVLEIYSWWGSSEARHDDLYLKGGKTDRRAYWQDALRLGYRYGGPFRRSVR